MILFTPENKPRTCFHLVGCKVAATLKLETGTIYCARDHDKVNHACLFQYSYDTVSLYNPRRSFYIIVSKAKLQINIVVPCTHVNHAHLNSLYQCGGRFKVNVTCAQTELLAAFL